MSSQPTASAVRHKSVDEMTDEERLESMRAFAEEKKYVTPGSGGTIQYTGIGGPISSIEPEGDTTDKYHGQYEAPLGPPGYNIATREEPAKKQNPVKKWLDDRKAKKAAKRDDNVPATVA